MSMAEEAARRRAADQALALLRHQGMVPSADVLAATRRFVAGEITLDELIALAKDAR